MPSTVLIVDDEPDLRTTLKFNLEREGYAVRTAETGSEGLAQAAATPTPNLILLDVMLPDLTGTEVCSRLRADPDTQSIAIIMLTAKDREGDRVSGLEAGADDYVVKPFSVRELMLRIRAVLRRGAAASTPTSLSFGELQVDRAAHRVQVAGGEISLTALEFKLLVTLMQRSGRVQSREGLLEEVWQMRADLTTRTVDTHVKRLRQKLGSAGRYVETVRGVGYRFREEDTP